MKFPALKPRPPQASVPTTEPAKPFDGSQTISFQLKMKNKAPHWFASMLAGTHREKTRIREELGRLKGAVPLLTPEERRELREMIRSASNVSPYLLIWVVPGSMIILPFLAWHLDTRRKRREARAK
jgi:hypothetical protein